MKSYAKKDRFLWQHRVEIANRASCQASLLTTLTHSINRNTKSFKIHNENLALIRFQRRSNSVSSKSHRLHREACGISRSPSPLEVEATKPTSHIQGFPNKIQTLHVFRHHGLLHDRARINTAARHFSFTITL